MEYGIKAEVARYFVVVAVDQRATSAKKLDFASTRI